LFVLIPETGVKIGPDLPNLS